MVEVEIVEPRYVEVTVVATGDMVVTPEGTRTTTVVVGLPPVGWMVEVEVAEPE
jgi:hypothetical protein